MKQSYAMFPVLICSLLVIVGCGEQRAVEAKSAPAVAAKAAVSIEYCSG